jgi:hypothetical protein
MVSFWWVLAGFIGGGSLGVLVTALMQMSGGLPEQSAQTVDFGGVHW